MPARAATAAPNRQGRLGFGLWLVGFYAAWLGWVAGHDAWSQIAAQWPIALTMLAGSYVAGSTPMGGGSVAFPILVLLLGEPASLGRSFAFAIQALGMSSAVLYLLASGRALAWGVLRWALLGSLLATPIGVVWLAPQLPELGVKLVYAVVWAAFGLITLRRRRALTRQSGLLALSPAHERAVGLFAGVIGGGCLAAATGVGADMLLYSLLVLRFRADLRIAIPTAVALMAFTSLVAVATRAVVALFDPAQSVLAPGVAAYWLAAAPVVVVGAPLGALAVSVIPRALTLSLVALLCLVQLVWSCVQAQLAPAGLALVAAAVLALVALIETQSARPDAAGAARVA